MGSAVCGVRGARMSSGTVHAAAAAASAAAARILLSMFLVFCVDQSGVESTRSAAIQATIPRAILKTALTDLNKKLNILLVRFWRTPWATRADGITGCILEAQGTEESLCI